MDQPTNATYTWLILSTAHGKYICKSEWATTAIKTALTQGADFDCIEAFELLTPVNQVPSNDPGRVGIAKDVVATPLDVNSARAITYFSLHGARVTFFKDMSAADSELYGKVIDMARSMSTSWHEQRSLIAMPAITLK